MKRHPSLIPLSHDHHQSLVQARRLRRAADAVDDERRKAAADFLLFFSADTVRHFREEEEQLFPALVGLEGEDGALLVQALLEHQRIHAQVGRLERGVASGEVEASLLRDLAGLLEAHVRLEERRLFPLLERVMPQETLSELELAVSRSSAGWPVVDLLAPRGKGPLWGTETNDLNATLLVWPPGGGTDEHVNSERDVIIVVLSGSATVTIEGTAHEVGAGQAVILEQGGSRRISAGPAGVRYLSVHRRRAPLQIASRSPAAQP